MPSTVFVTGGTGQIGLPLVHALVATGARVRALARGEAQQAALRAAGAEPVAGDLARPEALAAGMAGAEAIFHLAGGIRGPGSVDADQLNRAGTEAVIDAARRAGGVRIVYSSTCAVYGDRNGLWVPEDYPPAPHTAYGRSKVAAEQALLGSGLPVRVARIAAIYGPRCRFTLDGPIAAGRAWLPGEGKNLVPVMHVDDCVSALLRVAEAGADGEIYNLAGTTTPLLREFYAAVHRRVGGRPVRFWSTWIPSVFQFRAAALNERVASRLGRKPRFTADALLLSTSSVRLKTTRLEKELGFSWRYGEFERGLDAFLGAAAAA